jgi:hypothetical protein
MPTNTLKNSIASHPFRPAGIKVSPDLWKDLKSNGEITYARGFIEGVIDSQIDFPVVEKDIFIEIDFDLEGFDFELPSSPKKRST